MVLGLFATYFPWINWDLCNIFATWQFILSSLVYSKVCTKCLDPTWSTIKFKIIHVPKNMALLQDTVKLLILAISTIFTLSVLFEWIFLKYLKNTFLKIFGFFTVTFCIFLVASSRIFLGLHSWHQIIEGWCYGLILLCSFYLYEKMISVIKFKNRIVFNLKYRNQNHHLWYFLSS